MGIFSFISYHIEHILGIGAAIIFVIWAVTTIYAFNSIKKKQLAYNHPGTFFILMTTFTITGYYVNKTLNIETFILMVIWLVVAYFTLIWLKRNQKTDQRLPYLLAIQFVAIAIIMPILLKYMNLECLCEPVVHTTSEGIHPTISQALLSSIEKMMLWCSLIISFYAFKIGRRNKII
jgi:CDP-diglyceride synthetase